MRKILLVEDDDVLASLLVEKLAGQGHDVFAVRDGNHALQALLHQEFDLVLSDIVLPEKEGIETIGEIRRGWPSLPIIAMSGGGIGPAGVYLDVARRMGATKTLAKPFETSELLALVEELLPA